MIDLYGLGFNPLMCVILFFIFCINCLAKPMRACWLKSKTVFYCCPCFNIYLFVCNIIALKNYHSLVIGKPSKLPGHPDYIPSIFCRKKRKKEAMVQPALIPAEQGRKRERDFESVDAANVLVELCKHPRLNSQDSQLLVAHKEQCKKKEEQEKTGPTIQSGTRTVISDEQSIVKEVEGSSLESVTDVSLLQANVLALKCENRQLKRQVELLISRNNQLWDEKKKADHDFSKDYLALKQDNERLKKELESIKMEIKTIRFSSYCLNSTFKTFNY